MLGFFASLYLACTVYFSIPSIDGMKTSARSTWSRGFGTLPIAPCRSLRPGAGGLQLGSGERMPASIADALRKLDGGILVLVWFSEVQGRFYNICLSFARWSINVKSHPLAQLRRGIRDTPCTRNIS